MLAVLVAASCHTSLYTVQDTRLRDYLGFTVCDRGQGLGFVAVRALGTAQERGTIAHEKKHMEHIDRLGSCALYAAWIAQHRAEAEAEAFCEDVKSDIMPPRNWGREQAQHTYARWMADTTAYPQLRLSVDSALNLMRKYC